MQNPIVSSFHQEVSGVLTAMSVEHKVEHVTEDELFSVDVAIVEARIAIEVDGPWHYTLNTNQPLGHTILRYSNNVLVCLLACLSICLWMEVAIGEVRIVVGVDWPWHYTLHANQLLGHSFSGVLSVCLCLSPICL